MKAIISDILEEFNEFINNCKKIVATGGNTDNTRDTAANRLKLVLMHDRTNLAPETMGKMRDELIEVISKYVIIDEEALDLNLGEVGDAVALLASIPIVRAKTQEEIDEYNNNIEEDFEEEDNDDETLTEEEDDDQTESEETEDSSLEEDNTEV